MSYRITIKLRPYPYPPQLYLRSRWIQPPELGAVLQEGLGAAGRVVAVHDQQSGATIEYGLGGQHQFDSHESTLGQVAQAAEQLALQAFEADVIQLTRFGVHTAVVGGAGALGATSKQKPEVTFWATVISAFGGFLVGQLIQREEKILEARWNPYVGWTWTKIEAPPELRWSLTGA